MKNYHIKAYWNQIHSWESSAIDFKMDVSNWVREILDSTADGNCKPSFTEPQMRRGAGERDEIAADFQFRVEPGQVEYWTSAAHSEGLGIGEWIRQSLDYAVSVIELQEAV